MGDRQAKVEITCDGAERAAAAARQALQPWHEQVQRVQGAFGTLRGVAGQALGGVIQDLGRVVTVGASFSLVDAVQQINSMKQATSALAVASRKTYEEMDAQIDGIGKTTGNSSEKIAAFIGSLGRATHDFTRGIDEKSIAAFATLGRDTGRQVTELVPLAAAFKNLGIEEAAKGVEQIRANAASLKNVGGVSALTDEFTKLSGVLQHTSNSGSQLIALVAQLGKGARTPQEAEAAQQAITGSFMSNAGMYEAHFRRTGMLKRGETLIDRKTGRIDLRRMMELRQQELRQMGPERAFRLAAGQLGGPEAAAHFLNADLRREQIDKMAGEAMGSDALQRYITSPGGKAESDEAERLRNLKQEVGPGTWLDKASEAVRHFGAKNPLTTIMMGYGASAVLRGAGGALMRGGAGQVAGRAGGGFLRLLPRAVPGLAGGALLAEGLAHTLGSATAPLNENIRQIEGESAAQFATQRAGSARAIIRAAERSGGTEQGFIEQIGAPILSRAGYGRFGEKRPELAATADPVLKSVIDQLRSGTPELKGLPKDIAREMAAELRGSPLQITIVDATTEGVDVDQPGGTQ